MQTNENMAGWSDMQKETFEVDTNMRASVTDKYVGKYPFSEQSRSFSEIN